MNKKKILVDVTTLALGAKTETYRVIEEIVRSLIADISLEVFFTLSEEDFFQRQNIDLKAGLIKFSEESNIVTRFIDTKTDPAFSDIDIYLSTYYQVPDIWKKEHRVRKAVFAYDLIPLLLPDLYESETINIVRDFYNHLEKDWLIFSLSEITRKDLIEYRPDLDPDNIIDLHLEVDDKFSFHTDSREFGTLISDENEPQTKNLPQKYTWGKCMDILVNSISNIELDDTPFLSIITICYNSKYIEDTCQSIAAQSFQKFEWIVVDGGSNQETLGVLEKYKDYITVIVSEKDDGRYDAMNKGILLSKGKYLLFLNGGDFLCDRLVLEKIFSYSIPLNLINTFKLTLNSDIVFGEVSTRETGMFPYPLWQTGPQDHDIEFFNGNSLPHQATFIKSELFERIGNYNKDLKYASDYEWFMRAIILYGIKAQYLPMAVSVYNFEGVSSYSVKPDPQMIEINQIYNYYLNAIEKKSDSEYAQLLKMSEHAHQDKLS